MDKISLTEAEKQEVIRRVEVEKQEVVRRVEAGEHLPGVAVSGVDFS